MNEELVRLFWSYAAIGAALPVLFAFIVQFYRRVRVRKIRLENALAFNSEVTPTARLATPDWDADTRLSEARFALRDQESSISWNKRTANSLTFSQYVIGGVLASSFVQTQLSKEIIGFLGVLVLVSSLIHQRYRPDIKHRNGKQRAARLRAVIRKAEDGIFEARASGKDATAIPAIRQLVSEGLNELETAELNDLQGSRNGEA